MLIKPVHERKPNMKMRSFCFPIELIEKIEQVLSDCLEIEQTHKSDVVREAMQRGLASIQADIDAHKAAV